MQGGGIKDDGLRAVGSAEMGLRVKGCAATEVIELHLSHFVRHLVSGGEPETSHVALQTDRVGERLLANGDAAAVGECISDAVFRKRCLRGCGDRGVSLAVVGYADNRIVAWRECSLYAAKVIIG